MRFFERNWPAILIIWLMLLISVVIMKIMFLNPSIEQSFTVDEMMQGIRQNDSRLLEYIHGSEMFPPPIFQKLSLSNETFRNPKATRIVQEVIKILDGMRNGFFIECRAYEGEMLSKTLELEVDYDWTGVLMEPDPYLFPTLISKQRKAWLVSGCLSPDAIAHNQGFLRKIRNFTEEGMEIDKDVHQDGKGNYWKKLTIPCFPLFSIASALRVKQIDFLVLDSQGLELQILLNIPWDSLIIRVISVNVHSIPEGGDGVKLFMKSIKYNLISHVDEVLTFVRHDLTTNSIEKDEQI